MINRHDVETLSQLSSSDWPIVSLYLRVDKERIDEDYTIRLKNLLRDAAERLDDGYSHEQREAVLADLDRIRDFFRQEGSRFGRGVALFASREADIWQVFDISKEIESQIDVGETAVIAPLIRLIGEAEPYCTCLISRDQARIFIGRQDRIDELVQTRDEMVPGQHDQGGWAQARMERHVEEHVRTHFKNIAEQLFKIAEEQAYRFLILAGPDQVVSGFRETLHPYVSERYIGSFHLLLEANIDDVARESQTLLSQWRVREKERALEILRNEALSRDQGVVGLAETIQALQMGQIMTLVINDDLVEPGAVCRQCGSLQIQPAGSATTCVFCSGELELLDNVLPTIVTATFQQGARIVYLDTPELRAQGSEFGGIGAILRYSLNSA